MDSFIGAGPTEQRSKAVTRVMLGSLALVVLLAAAVDGMFAAFGALGRRQETLYPGLPQEDPPRCK